jgi:hypothetical protein
MGTKNLNVVHDAELANSNPKSVTEAHEEFTLFRAAKRKDDSTPNLDAGTPAYLVSVKWLKQYQKFILYE